MVVRAVDGIQPSGPQTPGMERRQLLEHEDRWIGWVRTAPGTASGWHHHGDRDTYILMTSGSIIIEFGPGGRDRIEPGAGDVGYVPPQTVHREITAGAVPGEAFVVRIGTGLQNVNVDGPDPVVA
jgi:uncharacterized RmlC-like cupin family protein